MTVLQDRCDQLAAAVDARDSEAVYNGIDALVVALQDADRDNIVATLARLAPVIEAVPLGVGSNLAYIIWQLLQPEIDGTALHEPLTRRVCEALERAARFPALWQQLTGDEAPPRPDDGSDNPEIPAILDRFKAAAPQLGLAEREAYQLAEAWFVCGLWVRPMLMLAQRKAARLRQPQRERLLAALAEAVEVEAAEASWLYGLVQVLDDEQLLVLHRPSGQGYRVTISGIGDNFQLHTMLAATLIGDAGQGLITGLNRPGADEIAAATDGEQLAPPGGISGNFNLVDAYGAWIWNEGRPADIPAFEGQRVIVLDPPPYARSWNIGRAYPLMTPSMTIDEILPREEAHAWLAKVAPSQR